MDGLKWYESLETDVSPVISSRVRLARNLKKYPFSIKINEEQSKSLIGDVVSSVKNEYMMIGESFSYIDMTSAAAVARQSMLEKHEISPEFLKYERPRGVLIKDDESIGIMINEEDHLRIQAVSPGNSIEKSYGLAGKIDDIIDDSLEYAFDRDLGYLTSCPSNTGTGLRASVMMHLPMLEKSGNLQSLSGALAKLGMTIRGIYGEGSKSYGSIYQISNQVTLGKTESEIMQNLKSVTMQIIDNEYSIVKAMFTAAACDMEDDIYRSWGLLANARKMSFSEAMGLLSSIRLGIMAGLIKKERIGTSVYNIMMSIKPGIIQSGAGSSMDESRIDAERAGLLRRIFAGAVN